MRYGHRRGTQHSKSCAPLRPGCYQGPARATVVVGKAWGPPPNRRAQDEAPGTLLRTEGNHERFTSVGSRFRTLTADEQKQPQWCALWEGDAPTGAACVEAQCGWHIPLFCLHRVWLPPPSATMNHTANENEKPETQPRSMK